MPKGVYERKPWMGNYGRTALIRDAILQDRETMSLRAVAKKYKISDSAVCHIQNGTWGNEWRAEFTPRQVVKTDLGRAVME